MNKEIYLAGGCFWGLEQYFSRVPGIVGTQVGYANCSIDLPTYEQVCRGNTNCAETVELIYDDSIISLPLVLEKYFDVINPTSINMQGGDVGSQYRTGIFYVNVADEPVIAASLQNLQQKHDRPIVIENMLLQNYCVAEDYHQRYLDKNPGGYCHIGADKMEHAKAAIDSSKKYSRKTKEGLQQELTELQYKVTQNAATETPFQNEYFDNFKEGIYVDITTGEPLFISTDKFDSGCGWPSFSKPISGATIKESTDNSLSRERIEVKSKTGDAHLGHVFSDGPQDKGGLRYCINSAALKFIPKDEMEKEGYAEYLQSL